MQLKVIIQILAKVKLQVKIKHFFIEITNILLCLPFVFLPTLQAGGKKALTGVKLYGQSNLASQQWPGQGSNVLA